MFGFSKGKIEILLSNYNYSPGQSIEGTVTLSLKKPLQAKELSIEIVGEQKITQGYGTRRSYRTERIFDFRQPLDGKKEYPAQPLNYPFKITIPGNVQAAQAMPEGTIGTVLKAAQMFSGTTSKTQWYLVAKLDVKGFDVRKKVRINIA